MNSPQKIDEEILRLLELRARLVTRQTDLPPRKMLLDAEKKETILREVASLCQQLVQPVQVAFLGPLYSYTHLAMEQFFGSGVAHSPVTTIESVFEEVLREQAHYGVVPIENSTDGRVVDALEMFTRVPVRICGEVEIPIHHTLMARCPREEIREVHSKPQALSQCRHWLVRHLPNVRLVEVTSTAAAAQNAQTQGGVAAVASPLAARAYELTPLVESIADNTNNVTRFVVLGKEDAPRTKHDKTSLMFALPHESGSLADALTIFKRHKINLTWIESFPIPTSPGTYLFFVDFYGHRTELKVRRALEMLEKKTQRLEILGSYPMAGKAPGK
ncbi:MAG: prephenate dehydratase [Planctomycetia bacterium]|nr:prephenate dehydratase [Planctomycetia bacterium]